jgi:uncharacterized Zn finger protein
VEISLCPCCGSTNSAFQSRAVPGGLDVTACCRECGCVWDSAYALNDVADDLQCEFSLTAQFGPGLD